MASEPRPIAPMSLAEAHRMIADPEFAGQFCEETRRDAFRLLHAHRRGDRVVVVILPKSARPKTPGDAA